MKCNQLTHAFTRNMLALRYCPQTARFLCELGLFFILEEELRKLVYKYFIAIKYEASLCMPLYVCMYVCMNVCMYVHVYAVLRHTAD